MKKWPSRARESEPTARCWSFKLSAPGEIESANGPYRGEKGRVVVFAAGTGNPFFTSDTAATLRAAEIDANVILMGKNKVDGVYDADPRVVPTARKYATLTYQEMLEKKLTVMDQTAAALAAERALEILVFDISAAGAMRRAVLGEPIGTLVHT